MIRDLVIRAQARADLVEIWNYIAADNPKAADKVGRAFDAAVEMLQSTPGVGHPRPDVRDKPYRFWRVYSYMIAYQYTDKTVAIIRVIHGRRDFRRIFGRG